MLNAAQRGYATPPMQLRTRGRCQAETLRRPQHRIRGLGRSGSPPQHPQAVRRSHDRVGVELAPHRLKETVSSGWIDHGRAIRSVRGHRVVCVRHRDDSRDRRDLRSQDPVGVTVAVNALVVMTNDRRNVGVCRDLGQDSLADLGVALHLPAFIKREAALLVEHRAGGSPTFPMSWTRPATKAALLLFGRQPQRGGDVACSTLRRRGNDLPYMLSLSSSV